MQAVRQTELVTPSKQGTQAPLRICGNSREQAAHGRSGGAYAAAEGSKLGSCGISTDAGGVEFAARGIQIFAQCVGCSFCGMPRHRLCTPQKS